MYQDDCPLLHSRHLYSDYDGQHMVSVLHKARHLCDGQNALRQNALRQNALRQNALRQNALQRCN